MPGWMPGGSPGSSRWASRAIRSSMRSSGSSFCKGLHAYRAGRFADAVTACREGRRLDGERQAAKRGLGASSLAVEAMALHRQGDGAAALLSLRDAKRRIDDGFSFDDTSEAWGTWLEASLLYREAVALIGGPQRRSGERRAGRSDSIGLTSGQIGRGGSG